MTKRRFFTLITMIIIIITTFSLSSCVPAQAPATTEAVTEETPTTAEETTAEEKTYEGRVDPNITATLEVWTYYDPTGPQTEILDPVAKTALKVVENFNKKYPNVKINFTVVPWDQIQDKVFTAGQAGQGPDVATLMIQRMAELVEPGLLYPITEDYLSDLDLEDWVNFEIDKGYAQFDGQLYGISQALHGRLLWYNKKAFKEAGLDPEKPPETWTQLVEYGKALTKGKQYGLAITAGEKNQATFEWLWPWIIAGGGLEDLFKKDGTAGWDGNAGQQAFQFIYDLFNVNKIVSMDAVGWVDGTEHFVAGDTAMFIGGTYRIIPITKALGDDTGYAPIPYPEGGHSVNIANSWALGISKASKNPDLAWELIKEWLTPEIVPQEATAEGAVPIRKSALKEITDPILLFFAENVGKYGQPVPPTKFHQQGQDITFSAIQEVILGKKDPAQAVKDSAAEFNALFK
ncbi:MAG: sugar ABC transporter substrate-binding protein [Actinobacteria bacterium]|nr:sugar ABC transporter substrate-binding protein [Actinomycetota bacterium]